MKTLTRNICLTAFSSVLGLSAVHVIAQQNSDYSEVIRELDIMSNIFEAALEPRRDNDGFRPVSILDESNYLANQGMVFTFIQPGNRGMMAFIDIDDMPGGALAGMGINMAEMAMEISTEVRRAIPSADFDFPGGPFASIAMMGGDFEGMENMTDAIRDQQEEVRDLQRDMRDLQRQLRDDNNDRTEAEIESSIENLQVEIDAERTELETLTSEYQGIMQEFQQERDQQVAARNEEAQSLILSTLCDYGNTLRSLQNDEHVTLVMRNFENNQDQVYVLDYADVTSCSSAEQLLQGAISYQL